MWQFVTCHKTIAQIVNIVRSRWGQLSLPSKSTIQASEYKHPIWFLKYACTDKIYWHTDGPGEELGKHFACSMSWWRDLIGGDLLFASENYVGCQMTRIPADQNTPKHMTLFDGNGVHGVDIVKHGERFALVISLELVTKVHE